MKPLVRVSDIDAEPPDWLWRTHVPRKMITIFGGRPDQGKGLLTVHMSAELSHQTNDEGKPMQIMISAAEDSYSIMTRPRLEAAGANMDNIQVTRFSLPRDLDELAVNLVGIDLLVIDPLASHLSEGVNRHTDSIRRVTDPLIEIIEETGTAVVVLEHVLKNVSRYAYPIAAIGGSGSGIVASARMAFLFGIDPQDGDRRILAPVKHNISAAPLSIAFDVDLTEVPVKGHADGFMDVPRLQFAEEIDFDPMLLVVKEKGKRGAPAQKRADACEWLAHYLYNAGGAILTRQINEDAKHVGMSKPTLKRASQDIRVIITPPGGGRNCTWDLPPETRARMERADPNVESTNVDTEEPAEEEGPGLLTEEDFDKLLGVDPEEEKEDDEPAA